MNMSTLQISAAQVQPSQQQPQRALNLGMNRNMTATMPNVQYVVINPQQYIQFLQQLQQMQFQQQLQMLPNANAVLPSMLYPCAPQQVLLPNQNMGYMTNITPNVPIKMQNNPTAIYTQSYNNFSMNRNSNLPTTTLSSPPSTNLYQNNNNNEITSIQHHHQYQPANSRNNSPSSSPKLLPIAEEKAVDEDECCVNEQSLNISAPVFSPSPPSSPSLTPSMHHMHEPQYVAKKLQLFEPKYPARAQLNIFIHKNLTNNLLDIIYEQFPNQKTLYYYLDFSTALQINDEQMYIFEYENNNGAKEKIIFVNYDLHCKQSGVPLYGLITANTTHSIKQNKWLWKLDKFMTAIEIENIFGIKANELPRSSRRQPKFQKDLQFQLQCIKNMDLDIIENTDWFNIQQIKSLRRDNRKNKKYLQIVAKINECRWIEQCKQKWHSAPAIPIVVKNKNGPNKHWIEWVKLIVIDECDNNGNKLYVGVSCKYSGDNKWEIKSICLDKGDIENKHRLLGLSEDDKRRYLSNFYNFHTTIEEIQWMRSN